MVRADQRPATAGPCDAEIDLTRGRRRRMMAKLHFLIIDAVREDRGASQNSNFSDLK